MSDFYNPSRLQKARKAHKCTYCAESIEKSDMYTHQTGVFDGSWYTSKMHPECFNEFCDDGGGEYTPFSNERPTAEA